MEVKTLLTKVNRTVMTNKQNKFIVIHYVGAVSSAYNNAKYFETVNRQASAHYFVDENDIYQVVNESDAAWHCGSTVYKHPSCRNTNSIGIEMCCFNNNGKIDVSEKVVERTIELTRELMNKYNIPIENVVTHNMVTGKKCPAPFVETPSRWSAFLNKLKSPIQGQFTQGERVLLDIPVTDVKVNGDFASVNSNGYVFEVHKSLVKNNRIHEVGTVVWYYGEDLYMVQLFDDANGRQFQCRLKYMSKV